MGSFRSRASTCADLALYFGRDKFFDGGRGSSFVGAVLLVMQ